MTSTKLTDVLADKRYFKFYYNVTNLFISTAKIEVQ
jgi:hypothetical protein